MPIGKIHVFDLDGGENWPAYVRLVEQFIKLNDIKDNLRVATLVTHFGAQIYRLMCDLCAPDNPEDKTFTTLVELVKNHLEPKRSEIAERHVFRQRRQGEGENIKVFLQNLKHLATYFNFENQLEVNIRDQFVSGLRSEEIRSRLFAETTLDYKKAVGLALALEAAEQHAAKAVARSPTAPWAAAGLAGLQADAGKRVHRVSVAGQASAAGRDVEAPRRKRLQPIWAAKVLGDCVLFRDYTRNNTKWMEGEVSERTGAVTYKVKSDQGVHQKHIDQIMPLRRHTRYSNPIITDTDNQTENSEKETWESAPNSPVTSSLQTSHDSPVIHETQSDYAVEPSTSGDWANNRPRNRNIMNID